MCKGCDIEVEEFSRNIYRDAELSRLRLIRYRSIRGYLLELRDEELHPEWPAADPEGRPVNFTSRESGLRFNEFLPVLVGDSVRPEPMQVDHPDTLCEIGIDSDTMRPMRTGSPLAIIHGSGSGGREPESTRRRSI